MCICRSPSLALALALNLGIGLSFLALAFLLRFIPIKFMNLGTWDMKTKIMEREDLWPMVHVQHMLCACVCVHACLCARV